ncbi:hypothetical protein LZ30DRAFT_177667 [Colletotrichum cereale]|nr:hypothetical protein LZ30DRAFT_177667 [Colletotrichum cereale]
MGPCPFPAVSHLHPEAHRVDPRSGHIFGEPSTAAFLSHPHRASMTGSTMPFLMGISKPWKACRENSPRSATRVTFGPRAAFSAYRGQEAYGDDGPAANTRNTSALGSHGPWYGFDPKPWDAPCFLGLASQSTRPAGWQHAVVGLVRGIRGTPRPRTIKAHNGLIMSGTSCSPRVGRL